MEDQESLFGAFEGNLDPLSDLIVAKLLKKLRGEPFVIPDSRAEGGIAEEDFLALEDAAARLQHSYSWLSRNYRKLGLRPSRIGRNLLFREAEIEALVARQKVRFRGRPSVEGKGTFLPPET